MDSYNTMTEAVKKCPSGALSFYYNDNTKP
ncbi:MAG: (4Fe-4S)-binding protein [Bacteroidetes bacterium]|nr:(4Fe-4S)-binding protein [Bacteroidota bacterium]